ncbi:hypothetical protein CANCADRAFT_43993 [Tortispora caseinolytica NRRL Y-17796]|uniref:Uncharacterized protein n=1 Tax=Tortispora caseinolytica NRRL Y-17796 TaxID=767744 RepID=A0A1E4TF25_9ASCO|nr:hypothetical protein CANCADRAFT_43993 [Tortispora caseinolytica NRRL Y-17796]
MELRSAKHITATSSRKRVKLDIMKTDATPARPVYTPTGDQTPDISTPDLSEGVYSDDDSEDVLSPGICSGLFDSSMFEDMLNPPELPIPDLFDQAGRRSKCDDSAAINHSSITPPSVAEVTKLEPEKLLKTTPSPSSETSADSRPSSDDILKQFLEDEEDAADSIAFTSESSWTDNFPTVPVGRYRKHSILLRNALECSVRVRAAREAESGRRGNKLQFVLPADLSDCTAYSEFLILCGLKKSSIRSGTASAMISDPLPESGYSSD